MADLVPTKAEMRNTTWHRAAWIKSIDTGAISIGDAVVAYVPASDPRVRVRRAPQERLVKRAVNSATYWDHGRYTHAGVALSAAAASGDMCRVAWQDTTQVDLGVSLTEGEIYVVSSTTAKIHPLSDLAAGEYMIVIGVGTKDGYLQLSTNRLMSSGPKPGP